MTAATQPFQIVLVKADADMEAIPNTWTTARGDGINAVACVRETTKLVACMWKRRANDSDLAKARDFAAREGYRVVLVPTNERNPLRYAKSKAAH